MIRQSFQNIVNPKNMEHFQTQQQQVNTSNYYQLISNMDSQCDVIIDEMDISKFNLNDENSCVVGGRTYAKSDVDYVTLRRENLNRIEEEYNTINGNNTLNDFEKHSQIVCLMNKLFHNIKQVTENNDVMEEKNLENENLARENETVIEANRDIKKKDKNLNLVTSANVVGSKESKNQIRVQYLIFIILIILFIVIQLVIFFV
jgi:hypothetical protein